MMATQKYEAMGHVWNFDDKDGMRSLPSAADKCIQCGQEWHGYARVPSKCVPRPVFTPKAENAPESTPEPLNAKSSDLHIVNGHEWPKDGEGMPKIGTECKKCGIKFATADAVYTCKGYRSEPVKIEKRETPPGRLAELLSKPEDRPRTFAEALLKASDFNDSAVWAQFAAAIASESIRGSGPEWIAGVAQYADILLEEYRKRFPS